MIHTGLPRHSTVSFSPGFKAEISTSTAARRFGTFGRLKTADEGGGHKAGAYGTSASGGNQPSPLAVVDWGVTHGNPLASRYQGQPEIVAE